MNFLILIAESDTVTIARMAMYTSGITALVTVAGLVAAGFTLWMQYKTKLAVEAGTKQGSEDAKVAAARVEEVKTTLDTSTSNQDGKLNEILQFVNSPYGIALALNAGNARFKANSTKSKDDTDAAELAEKLLKEHRDNQAKADAATKHVVQKVVVVNQEAVPVKIEEPKETK